MARSKIGHVPCAPPLPHPIGKPRLELIQADHWVPGIGPRRNPVQIVRRAARSLRHADRLPLKGVGWHEISLRPRGCAREVDGRCLPEDDDVAGEKLAIREREEELHGRPASVIGAGELQQVRVIVFRVDGYPVAAARLPVQLVPGVYVFLRTFPHDNPLFCRQPDVVSRLRLHCGKDGIERRGEIHHHGGWRLDIVAGFSNVGAAEVARIPAALPGKVKAQQEGVRGKVGTDRSRETGEKLAPAAFRLERGAERHVAEGEDRRKAARQHQKPEASPARRRGEGVRNPAVRFFEVSPETGLEELRALVQGAELGRKDGYLDYFTLPF